MEGEAKRALGARIGSYTGLREPGWVIVRSTRKTEPKGEAGTLDQFYRRGVLSPPGELAPLKEPQRHRWKENAEKISLLEKK